MYCPNCKQEFDGKFCPECGTKLIEKTQRICPNCNIEVESKFCPECGTKTVEVLEKMVKMCPNCKIETESKFCPECGAMIVEMAVKTPVTGEVVATDTKKKSTNKKSDETANTKKTANAENAAAENDVVTYYNTAMEYHLGINGKKTDGKKAAEWYQRAAEMGLAEAQVQLAGCYRRGWGVESDIDLAFEWYHKAAEQGNGWAQYALGNLYGNSLKGHPRDEKEMQKWYKMAFAQGIRELPGLPEPLSPEAMAKAAELQAAGTKVTVEKKNNKPTETKNMEEKKTFKVEVSVYGSYGMEAGWVDTEEYDVDTMTKNQCSGIYRECNFSAGFAPGLGMQFELAVYDEQGEKVFTSERMEDFPFVETIEDLKKIKFFKSNAKEVFEECEKRKRKDLSFVSTGIYVISLCEKKWMIYEFKIVDDDFHPEKLFFWPDFSAGMLAGTRLTNPYNIFYGTRFAKAWDITDREDSFGYTLSLQEVDEDGNWTMLNSFNQDDEDEDWNDDENEDWEDDEDEDEVITTEIEMEAFYDSEDKKSITIPDSVTSIESGVFANNSGLTSIVVADGNTVYDSRDNCNAIIETATNTLFAGCQSTVIPNSVTSIDSYAFSGCTGLTSIEIPNSVTRIGTGAFKGCTGLTSIEIPNSVTFIGIGTFLDCTGLTSIEIPNSVTLIGTKAFWRCTNLKSIKVPAGKGDYFKELLHDNELAKLVVEIR